MSTPVRRSARVLEQKENKEKNKEKNEQKEVPSPKINIVNKKRKTTTVEEEIDEILEPLKLRVVTKNG